MKPAQRSLGLFAICTALFSTGCGTAEPAAQDEGTPGQAGQSSEAGVATHTDGGRESADGKVTRDGASTDGSTWDDGASPEGGAPAGLPQEGGPATDEVLIVINKNNPDSQEIGNYYAERWGVPKRNLVYVDWPLNKMGWGDGRNGQSLGNAPSFTDVTNKIKAPIDQAISARGLTINVIVLAWDLPYLMRDAGVSYAVQNYLAVGTKDSANTYYGKLGAAQRTAGGTQKIVFHLFGYDTRLVKAMIDRGITADQSHPDGTVYFMPADGWSDTVSGDIQGLRYPNSRMVAPELVAMGLKATRTATSQDENFAPDAKDVLGVVTGYGMAYTPSKNYLYGQIGFLPGALADHLTSGAGRIDVWSDGWHYNMNEWIALGATATHGAVDEPYGTQTRFPHPRMYLGYAQGASIGETYYSGLSDPILACFVGDPLSAPFAVRPTLTVSLAEGATISSGQTVSFSAATTRPIAGIGRVQVAVDGASLPDVDAPRWRTGDKIHLGIDSKTFDYTVADGATQNIVVTALVALVNADTSLRVTADNGSGGEFPGALTLRSKSNNVTVPYYVTVEGRLRAAAVGTQTYGASPATPSIGRVFIAPGDPTFSGSFTLDAATLGEGWHTLRVTVSDSSLQGVTHFTQHSFLVPSTRMPSILAGDGSILPISLVSDSPVAVKVNESFASLDLRVNGVGVQTLTGAGPYAANLDLSAQSQGTVELQAVATDDSGKKVYGPIQRARLWKRTTVAQFGPQAGSGRKDTPWVLFSQPIDTSASNLAKIKIMSGATEIAAARGVDTYDRVVRLEPTAALPTGAVSLVVPADVRDAYGNTVTAATHDWTPIDDATLVFRPQAATNWFTGNVEYDSLMPEWSAGDGTLTFSGVVNTWPRATNTSEVRVGPLYKQGPQGAPIGFSNYFQLFPYNSWATFEASTHVRPTNINKSGYSDWSEIPGGGIVFAVGPNAIYLRCYNWTWNEDDLHYEYWFRTAKGLIKAQDTTYTAGQEYDFRIVSDGAKVDAYINGALYASSTETVEGGTLRMFASQTGQCDFTSVNLRLP